MEMTYPFGRDKGKPLSQVKTESLMYYIGRTDVNDPKYGAKNKAMVDECHRIINERTDKPKTAKGIPINKDLTVGSITTNTPQQKDGSFNATLLSIERKLDSIIKHLGLNVVEDLEESGSPF